MTLDEIEKHIREQVTPRPGMSYVPTDIILALVACVRAADAMLVAIDEDRDEGTMNQFKSGEAFRTARAKLEGT